jgi:hypothetical protein
MSTPLQKVSAVFGAVFLLIGILGFVLGSSSMSPDHLFGLFRVNIVHNIVHALFGAWGLVASRTHAMAESYAQIAGVVYLVLALLGFFAPDGFGFVPIGDHNIWLHGLIGLVLLYFGFGSVLAEDNLRME